MPASDVSTGPRVIAWLKRNRQYLFLLLLDLVFFSAWSVLSGIAPGGDIRAHIFRTLEFGQGLWAGDYTPIPLAEMARRYVKGELDPKVA